MPTFTRSDGEPPFIYRTAVSRGELVVAGIRDTAGGVPVGNMARWAGAAWRALGDDGVDGEVSALAVDGDDVLYVSGAFTRAGNVAARSICRVGWNGVVRPRQRPRRGGRRVCAVRRGLALCGRLCARWRCCLLRRGHMEPDAALVDGRQRHRGLE